MSIIRIISTIFFLKLAMFLSAQDQVVYSVSSVQGMAGQVVCVDITADNFTNVNATQFVIRFDPKVLELVVPIDLTNSALNGGPSDKLFASSFNLTQADLGFINFTWFDGDTFGVSFDDSGVLFTLCFTVLGGPCSNSTIAITESGQLSFEVSQADPVTAMDILSIPLVNNGSIEIMPKGFEIHTSICSSSDTDDTGRITFSTSGGVGPYSWEVVGTGESGTGLDDCDQVTINDLAPGTYTIRITDANGTIRNQIVTIQSSSEYPFFVELDPIDPSCFDRNNGAVLIDSVVGGEGPFTFEWSTFEFLEDGITKLYSGDYGVTVTDVNGCTASADTSINADTLKLVLDNLVDPTCEGLSDGFIQATASGGTPFGGGNYVFEVEGIDNSYFATAGPTNPFAANNLPDGTFTIVAVDGASPSCYSDELTFSLNSESFEELTIETENVLCGGECNGSVLITAASSGNFGFMVNRLDGTPQVGAITQTTYDADDLCPGQYNVTIVDVIDGCEKDTFFFITSPNELVFTILDSIGPGCGGGDGFMQLDAIGGVEPYTVEWNDGFDQLFRPNMGGGNYSVTLTDANDCEEVIDFAFADGGTIGLEAIVCNAVTCFGASDGQVCASVTVDGDFTYEWANDAGENVGSGEMVINLPSGIYYVTATDGECTDVDTVILVEGQKPSIDAQINGPSCSDTNDGSIAVMPVDGVLPFEYEWTLLGENTILSTTNQVEGGLGLYNLNIIDAQGCEIDTVLEILPSMNTLQVEIDNIVGTPCFDECQGSAVFTATGGPAGTGNYTYFTSSSATPIPGLNMLTFDQLCPGEQWVYVIDGICQSDTIFFTVPNGPLVELDSVLSVFSPPSCFGDQDGEISLVFSGNPSNLSINWPGLGQNGSQVTNLAGGQYEFIATYNNGCTINEIIDLSEPDELVVTIDQINTIDISCFSSSTGRIELDVAGGNGEFTYDWSPNVSDSEVATGLGLGLYEVTVTDQNGCSDSTSYELTSADPIEATFDIPGPPNCYGGQVCIGVTEASGGVGGPYNFAIGTGGVNIPIDTCVNVFAGPLSISVFDAAGCSLDTTFIIDQPEELTVDLGEDITIDLGGSSDPISAFIVNEFPIDSILWSPINDLECNTTDCQIVTVSPLENTTYQVTVVDENGCTATDDIMVSIDLTRNVYLPNIFSPNGDNTNDYFQLGIGSGVTQVNFLKIYDRWGNLVFHDEAYMPNDVLHPGWDGRFGNSDVVPGVYVFIAEVVFLDNAVIRYKGDVTIVR